MSESGKGRDRTSIDELLQELTELRELDQRRNTHAPGSPAHDRVTRELEDRTRRLMDRFREFELLRPAHRPLPSSVTRFDAISPATMLHLAQAAETLTIGATRTG